MPVKIVVANEINKIQMTEQEATDFFKDADTPTERISDHIDALKRNNRIKKSKLEEARDYSIAKKDDYCPNINGTIYVNIQKVYNKIELYEEAISELEELLKNK
jgi:hypothetical protein